MTFWTNRSHMHLHLETSDFGGLVVISYKSLLWRLISTNDRELVWNVVASAFLRTNDISHSNCLLVCSLLRGSLSLAIAKNQECHSILVFIATYSRIQHPYFALYSPVTAHSMGPPTVQWILFCRLPCILCSYTACSPPQYDALAAGWTEAL